LEGDLGVEIRDNGLVFPLPKKTGAVGTNCKDTRGLASWLSAVSFKYEADITITGNDCESQRSLHNSEIEYWYAPRPRKLFFRVTAPGDFKYFLQTIRSCDEGKVIDRGIEFIREGSMSKCI
jgi:hypothetical protein